MFQSIKGMLFMSLRNWKLIDIKDINSNHFYTAEQVNHNRLHHTTIVNEHA